MTTKKTKLRIAFVVSLVAAGAACSTVDLAYDTTNDGGGADGGADGSPDVVVRIIRDSSFVEPDAVPPPVFDPSDAEPCAADSDDGGGCDFSQGLGCCIVDGGQSRCIFQSEIAAKCAKGLFVGCRADDPAGEAVCCWRDGPAESRISVLATSCDGGAHACNPDSGQKCANDNVCTPTGCTLDVGTFWIGSCGPKEACR